MSTRNFGNAIICVFWLWILYIKYIVWAIWCYLQIKYFPVAFFFFTTNDSFLFTAATRNFMFLTRCDQDFYTAFPWIYLPLFRVPSYTWSLTVFLSLWQRDCNRKDSYQVSMVDVPQSPTAGGTRGPWQQRLWLLALPWRMIAFCTTKCRHFLPSPCTYNLFAKVKEPLWGTWYNTRDELMPVIR